jgi:hypothetical protein
MPAFSKEFRMDVPPVATARVLGLGRTAIAAQFLLTPAAAIRLVGLDTGTARRVSWLVRMMAVRDGALGIGGLLAARRGGDPTPWVLGGAAADAVDAAVLAHALRTGRLRGAVPALATVGAAGVAALGAVTAVRLLR